MRRKVVKKKPRFSYKEYTEEINYLRHQVLFLERELEEKKKITNSFMDFFHNKIQLVISGKSEN